MSASRSADSDGRWPLPVVRRRLLVLLLAAGLAACGKKGRLELPPEEEDER